MKPTYVNAQQKGKKKKKKKKEKTRQEKRRKRGERKPKGVRWIGVRYKGKYKTLISGPGLVSA